MNMHFTQIVSCCFAVLRQMRSINRSVVQSLIVSMVISWLDNGSATLAGFPASQLGLYVAARLIYSSRKFEHVTPLLNDLHWLQIRE